MNKCTANVSPGKTPKKVVSPLSKRTIVLEFYL